MGFISAYFQDGGLGGIQLALASAYESRVHTISKMTTPRAQFAGDTAVTLTDGSYNIRTNGTNIAVPKSATAFLANTSNTRGVAGNANNNWGKPLIIKVKRDEFNSDIMDYAVFNADGTFPGADPSNGGIPANFNPYDPKFNPWSATAARYRVNTATGEIYLNKAGDTSTPNGTFAGIRELFNPDGIVNFPGNTTGLDNDPQINSAEYTTATDYDLTNATAPTTGTGGTLQQDITNVLGDLNMLDGDFTVATNMPTDKVVGMVEFEGLQGGALSLAQQQAAELSGIIQSLTSILRSTKDSQRGLLSLIK